MLFFFNGVVTLTVHEQKNARRKFASFHQNFDSAYRKKWVAVEHLEDSFDWISKYW